MKRDGSYLSPIDSSLVSRASLTGWECPYTYAYSSLFDFA